MKRVGQVLGGMALVAVLVPMLAALVLTWPYLRDDWVLDRTARAVALDWRDFGESRARERLQYELDLQHVGAQVGDDDCVLQVEQESRVVSCAWRVDVVFPFVNRSVPLSFASRASIGPRGDLH